MNETAELVAPSQSRWIWMGDPPRRHPHRYRCLLTKGAVRAVSVVVIDEFAEDRVELRAMENQQPVETLASCSADEPLGERVRTRGPNRRANDPDALCGKHLVEARSELGITYTLIFDNEFETPLPRTERHYFRGSDGRTFWLL